MEQYDCVVIGGGFFGTSIAAHESRQGQSVLLLEAESSLLSRASYSNQARIHGGYHYPRSYLTAKRSQVNFHKFVERYPEAIVSSFTKIYAVARKFSWVTARQFLEFCTRIGAPIRPASREVTRLFNPDLVEGIFEVQEYALDSSRLSALVEREMSAFGVKYKFETQAHRIHAKDNGDISIEWRSKTGAEGRISTHKVTHCAYSRLNEPLIRSGLPPIPLRHEWTEMALVEPPSEIADLGITLMDGPFFSIMPFPPQGLHTLSHVRFTPHFSWEEKAESEASIDPRSLPRETAFEKMAKDVARFLPGIGPLAYRTSLWEVKTVLPRSETNDSRPILFRKNHGIKNLNLVLGGKLDNIFDIIAEIESTAR